MKLHGSPPVSLPTKAARVGAGAPPPSSSSSCSSMLSTWGGRKRIAQHSRLVGLECTVGADEDDQLAGALPTLDGLRGFCVMHDDYVRLLGRARSPVALGGALEDPEHGVEQLDCVSRGIFAAGIDRSHERDAPLGARSFGQLRACAAQARSDMERARQTRLGCANAGQAHPCAGVNSAMNIAPRTLGQRLGFAMSVREPPCLMRQYSRCGAREASVNYFTLRSLFYVFWAVGLVMPAT